jgi:SAM-dependent MidA family methyltransferase
MEDVLGEPGERDITAHVNFSELRAIAVECGFEVESDSSLRHWVLSIWTEEKLNTRWGQADLRWRMQWKKLAFEMGETFRVLVLRKLGEGRK